MYQKHKKYFDKIYTIIITIQRHLADLQFQRLARDSGFKTLAMHPLFSFLTKNCRNETAHEFRHLLTPYLLNNTRLSQIEKRILASTALKDSVEQK